MFKNKWVNAWSYPPYTLSLLYNKKLNKKIYLFGEAHVRNTTCLNKPNKIKITDLLIFIALSIFTLFALYILVFYIKPLFYFSYLFSATKNNNTDSPLVQQS